MTHYYVNINESKTKPIILFQIVLVERMMVLMLLLLHMKAEGSSAVDMYFPLYKSAFGLAAVHILHR